MKTIKIVLGVVVINSSIWIGCWVYHKYCEGFDNPNWWMGFPVAIGMITFSSLGLIIAINAAIK